MSPQHALEVCKKKSITTLMMEWGLGWLVGFMLELKGCSLKVAGNGHVDSGCRVVSQ
jgi:hypothetical protein